MTDDADYLDRYQQKQLREQLKRIPGICEDLLNVQTRQARITKRGIGEGRRPKKMGSAIPYHMGASEAADRLYEVTVKWVQYVISQRGGTPPNYTTIPCSTWLAKNVESLALCEGSVQALDDFDDAIQFAIRVVDIPPDDYVVVDPQRVEAANRSMVTLSTVGTVASKIGPPGAGLNRDRLRLLAKHGDVKHAHVDPESGTKFYHLGDVIAAHLKRKARARKNAG